MASAAPAAGRVDRKLQLREVIDWLVEDGMIEREAAAKVIEDNKFVRGSARHPLVVITEARLRSAKPPHSPIQMEALTEWLAGKVKMPYYHIDPLEIDLRAVTQVMSSDYAQRRSILPVEVNGKEVTIATSEPFIAAWEKELSEMLRLNIKRVLTSPIDLERYHGEFFNLAKSMKRAESVGVQTSGLSNFEQLVELGKAGRQLDANDHHIVHLVDWLWQYAFDQRASDIHLEPRRDKGIIRFRIDGVLHEVYQVPFSVLVAMTSRIKILGRMDVVEKRRPQDGRIKTRTPEGQEIELRLSSLPTAHGEKLVMRIFDPEVLMRDFTDLGFTKDELEVWNTLVHSPGGIVLVTGPTGSGKTTTLYTTLKTLATSEVNVCTIEDPIEMVDARLNQMQVQPDIDVTFASGVRASHAAGPGHHHGRRDPRSRDRGHGGAGRAHRPPRALDAAHERCALVDHAPPRPRRACLPAQCDGDRRHGAAPGAHALPALQGEDGLPARGGPAALGERGRAFQGHAARRGFPSGGLPRVPQYRLPRPHRRLRDPADDARREALRGREVRARPAHPGCLQGRDASAAHLRGCESRAGHHDVRGSDQGRSARLVVWRGRDVLE
jgi:hypothetical protein